MKPGNRWDLVWAWLLPGLLACLAGWSRLRAVSGPDTLVGDVLFWGIATVLVGGLVHGALGARRIPKLVLLLLASLGWAIQIDDLSRPEKGEGPDILLVSLDTLRADHVGPSTPNLQALIGEGAHFTNAVTTAPLTAPAHASMLTGRTTPEHGLAANGDRLDLPTVVPRIAEQGYATAAFVSSRVLGRSTALNQGFALYADVWTWKGRQGAFPWVAALVGTDRGSRRGDNTVQQALDWWGHQDGPRFAWVHLYDIHSPYAPPPEWGPDQQERQALAAQVRATPAPEGARDWMESLPERHAASQMALYAGEVAFADHLLGELLAAVGPDTVVIVVSDHGEGFGEHGDSFVHGANLYEPTLHVPLIVRWSGHVTPGPRDQLTSIQAVAGILAEASGADWDTPGLDADPESVLAFTPGQQSRSTMTPATLVAALRFHDSKLIQDQGDPARGYGLRVDPKELLPLEPDWIDRAASQRLVSLLDQPPEALSEEALEQLKTLGYFSPEAR